MHEGDQKNPPVAHGASSTGPGAGAGAAFKAGKRGEMVAMRNSWLLPGTPETNAVPLGKSGISISRIGAGTWQWGNRFYWGYGRSFSQQDLLEAYETARAAGMNFFDTAEVYSSGRSERLLGWFMRQEEAHRDASGRAPLRFTPASTPPVVATKFFPFPWRVARRQLRSALRSSLRRLGVSHIGLYQTHFPLPPRAVTTWVDEIGAAVEEGLVSAVGVSNYSADSVKRAYEVLERRGIPLTSNQVGYSLLNRKPERNGVIETCRELGVTVIAYGPLGEGILTGKYEGRGLPLVRRVKWKLRRLPSHPNFIGLMREIGQQHGGASPAQVALNWCSAKGTVPIAGIKNARQAKDNFAALEWTLKDSEVATLDEASAR